MVAIEDIRSWVSGEVYAGLLDVVAKRLGLLINNDGVPEVVFQLDANKLNLAKLDPNALAVVAQDSDLVCSYVAEKLKALSGTVDEQEGKHSEDEEDVVLETHAFYSNFLNLYLIELHFLMFDPAGLNEYLKSIRIPASKKYAAQLSKVYELVTQ